ncbi:hypothetical protein QCA50_005367 [Cerrena zonata]|uniref:Uncharacterized protein n=1 Tax=Cerrena zonata TaxID=2478898 RepID=A0AAW0GPY2_9APHY
MLGPKALLVAPVERDIRIVSVINPFYAAALPSFSQQLANAFAEEPQPASPKSQGVFVTEGHRALRTAIFARHLQRVLDALPNRGPTLDGKKNAKDTPASQHIKPKHSNIISVSVCPGISRTDTMAPLLNADREVASSTWRGLILYLLLYPLLWLFAKSPTAALQTVIHALFLPTPFKRALAQVSAAADPSAQVQPSKQDLADKSPEEVLKPGALYRECSIVTLQIPPLPSDFVQAKEDEEKKRRASKKTKDEDVVELDDDGEFGGEIIGRTVWEWYEMKLKEWEAREKANKPVDKGKEKEGSQPKGKDSPDKSSDASKPSTSPS